MEILISLGLIKHILS